MGCCGGGGGGDHKLNTVHTALWRVNERARAFHSCAIIIVPVFENPALSNSSASASRILLHAFTGFTTAIGKTGNRAYIFIYIFHCKYYVVETDYLPLLGQQLRPRMHALTTPYNRIINIIIIARMLYVFFVGLCSS